MGLRQNTAKPYDEFEAMRRRAAQQQNAQKQEASQGLERNFARGGGLNSGAFIKQNQLLDEQANRQAADTEDQIRGQELQEGKRIEDRNFQANLVQTENQKNRDFQKDLSDKDMSFKDKVFQAEDRSRLKQMEIQQSQFDKSLSSQQGQFDKSYALEKDAQEFNKQMARIEADRPTDLLGSLLGSSFSLQSGQKSILSPLSGALGGLGGAFCFVAGTLVRMADGSHKVIEDIGIGDKCEIGGNVYFIGKGKASDIFDFRKVIVTGEHAFYEEKERKWKRVKNAFDAIPIIGMEIEVYFLSNENHRIMIGENMFADFDEVNNGRHLSNDESLKQLNWEEKSWPK